MAGHKRSLLDWLLQQHPDTPKSRAKQWILAGRVSVDGVIIRQPHHEITNPSAAVALLDRHARHLDCGSGWQIHPRVTLLHLDSSLAIINKGSGLISVPTANTGLTALGILADFLAGRLKAQRRGSAGKSLPPAYRRLQPLPVHRLDQYTTGVFCVALNPSARGRLIDQLKSHTMKREYVAYVEGRPRTTKGTWRQWLQLSENGLRQRVTSARENNPDAVEAITHYEVITEYPLAEGKDFVTKLKLELETGRKHQIRIQAAAAGLPLIGDRTYNPRYRQEVPVESFLDFPRQALHAATLRLEHPEQPGKIMAWTAPIPYDLRQLEATLRAR
jgi:23S rRNA pseudouridine1911/1915/1917 synthase